jgi:phosphoribosyl-AMP cyclohydrolase
MKTIKVEELDFEKSGGLIPVIVQDYRSLRVLTLAYTNEEALKRTVETGYAHFFRRSFWKVMKKGDTSGNIEKIIDILVDCDCDALVFLVDQTGIACHLGEESCFHNKLAEALPSGSKR